MKIGYARVSTQDQDLFLQLDALNDASCKKIYQEKITGSTKERPQLIEMLEQIREEDVVVIWKLDRLARSLKDLVSLVNEIQEKGGALHSLNDQIDTTTPHGKFTFHVFAEFERGYHQRTDEGGAGCRQSQGEERWTAERRQPGPMDPVIVVWGSWPLPSG
jgi:DNA invertase Pin-like site-specific DNA recombinase